MKINVFLLGISFRNKTRYSIRWFPSTWSLILYTHFDIVALLLVGRSVSVQVSFSFNTRISCAMAALQLKSFVPYAKLWALGMKIKWQKRVMFRRYFTIGQVFSNRTRNKYIRDGRKSRLCGFANKSITLLQRGG